MLTDYNEALDTLHEMAKGRTDFATNGDGDSGRFKMLNDWEHDDPEQSPGIVYESHGPAMADVMTDLRLSHPYPHGLQRQHMRYCACCDGWKLAGAVACSECGAEWEKRQ